MPRTYELGATPSASALDHDNQRFVAALLRAYLQADLLPPTFTVPRFRTALLDFKVISGGAAR